MCREVANRLNLTEGVEYVRVCMGEHGFDAMVADLQERADVHVADSNDANTAANTTVNVPAQYCDMSAQAITVTLDRTDTGIQWSRTTYRGYLATLVSAAYTARGIFEFLSPLAWSVWMLLITSAFIVPLLVIFLESAFSERCDRGTHTNELHRGFLNSHH